MGSPFLAPYTELICSGSVSDFVTMSEPLDQGAKGKKTHLEIRCFLTCGRVEIPTFFCVLRVQLSPLFSDGCSESGTVWGLSWKVTEHVVT